MFEWSPHSRDDLLAAHGVIMAGLIDEPGRFRSGGVGIQRGAAIIHLAPPADRVPALIAGLLAWLRDTPEHPLIASCVFHYEFEFIHPFQDGNGRMVAISHHNSSTTVALPWRYVNTPTSPFLTTPLLQRSFSRPE
ncbi:MAG: Fic family protein, partial [Kiritimatiellae bacterium]|nr:Fic family protein [Kiritimatiellia bacterium]